MRRRRSSNWSWTAIDKVRRSVGFAVAENVSTDWSCDSNPRPPAMARIILLNSPNSCCHFFREVRRWCRGSEPKSSTNRSRRWAGSSMVRLTVSRVQPKMIFRVAHAASPFNNFFRELGSFRCGLSVGSRGRRTASIHSNNVRRAALRIALGL